MLMSKFYSNNFNNEIKREILTKNILNKTNFIILIIFLIALYLLLNLSRIITLSKFEFFNELLVNNGFVIENIEIKGINHLNKNEILKIISSYNKINILSINFQKINEEINNITWVKKGSIKVVYPNTIKIFLTEKEPIAILQNKFGNTLISKSGNLILEKKLNHFKSYLPIVNGKNAQKNIGSIFEILNLNKVFAKNIWSLTFVSGRRWDIHFKQGLTVRLPHSNTKEAWQKVIFLNENFKILNIGLTEIDLRKPNQILGKINVDKKLIFEKRNL